MNSKHPAGFTLIELLIAIGIFVLIATLSASALLTAKRNLAFKNELRSLIGTLRLAQNNSVTSLHGLTHGIYFRTNSYVLFSGDWNTPFDLQEYPLAPGLNFYNGGEGQIVFERLTGDLSLASSTLNHVFLGQNADQKKEITVDGLGNISLKN